MSLSKKSILDSLNKSKSKLVQFGIIKIGLFGSYVRNEQKEDSDIDILIDFKDGEEKFNNLINTCEVLDELFLGKKVEVVTLNSLSPYIGPYILKEVQYA